MNQQEEIRIAIAEACGWKWREGYVTPFGASRPEMIWFTPKGVPAKSSLPDFCNDLNAMHEIEMLLDKHGHSFGGVKASLSLFDCYKCELADRFGRSVRATAAQRAEAFCRTLKIGPFKESLLGGQNARLTTPKPEPVESLSGAPPVTHTRGEESAESPAAS